MALKNRKIRKKHRGTRNCGRGMKGSRRKGGGRGLAGSAKHKKLKVLMEDPNHFGKHGMGMKKMKEKYISIEKIAAIARENKLNEIDVTKMGYNRIIGKGNIDTPIKIKTTSITNAAKEKIEKAGGSVEII